MADAVGVQLSAEPLRDDVDVIVLEVFRDPRHESYPDRCRQQQAHALEEFAGRVLLEPRRVLVDDVAEDQRIEQREDLVDGGQDQRQHDQRPVLPQVGVEDFHKLLRLYAPVLDFAP